MSGRLTPRGSVVVHPVISHTSGKGPLGGVLFTEILRKAGPPYCWRGESTYGRAAERRPASDSVEILAPALRRLPEAPGDPPDLFAPVELANGKAVARFDAFAGEPESALEPGAGEET